MHRTLVESPSTGVNVPPQENKRQLGFTCARNLFCPGVEQKKQQSCVKGWFLPSFAATLMHILLLCRFHTTVSLKHLVAHKEQAHRYTDNTGSIVNVSLTELFSVLLFISCPHLPIRGCRVRNPDCAHVPVRRGE